MATVRKRKTISTSALRKIAVVVYPRLLAIMAEKPDGKRYRHNVKSRVPILGLPDGSLLIPARGRRLWGSV